VGADIELLAENVMDQSARADIRRASWEWVAWRGIVYTLVLGPPCLLALKLGSDRIGSVGWVLQKLDEKSMVPPLDAVVWRFERFSQSYLHIPTAAAFVTLFGYVELMRLLCGRIWNQVLAKYVWWSGVLGFGLAAWILVVHPFIYVFEITPRRY